MTIRVVVSRRNLQTLLSKLDRKRNGEVTACTLLLPHGKSQWCELQAVEDEEKYKDRTPGPVHPKDREKTGV